MRSSHHATNNQTALAGRANSQQHEGRRQYKGKYPTRIKTVIGMKRVEGEHARLLLICNNGARYTLSALHRNAPMPVPGDDIEDLQLFVEKFEEIAR